MPILLHIHLSSIRNALYLQVIYTLFPIVIVLVHGAAWSQLLVFATASLFCASKSTPSTYRAQSRVVSKQTIIHSQATALDFDVKRRQIPPIAGTQRWVPSVADIPVI